MRLGVLTALLSIAAAARAAAEVPPAADQVRPLLIGAAVPSVELTTAEGQSVNLADLVRQRRTVLVFYRGGWCPYCNHHLADLQAVEPNIVAAGWQILAISPDRPENLTANRQRHHLAYKLLSDSSMAAARAFGIAFEVDAATRQRYQGFGIDLEAASGRDHHQLPVPSVFLVGPDGRLRFTYVNPDYRTRLHGSVLLAAVQAENAALEKAVH